MSLFSFLKSPEHIGDAVKAVIKTGDAIVWTDEEKSEFQKDVARMHLEHVKATHGENSETSVARRWVALIITVPFVFLTVGSALIHLAGSILDSDTIIEAGKHWNTSASDNYALLVGAVVVFYFGDHIAKRLKN